MQSKKIDYNGKKFKPISNTENGETSAETVFTYIQNGSILYSEYTGGKIIAGHLLGTVAEDGTINMVYHHINDLGEIMTGKCVSTLEILDSGKLRLHESWQWTNGDQSRGNSILEEI